MNLTDDWADGVSSSAQKLKRQAEAQARYRERHPEKVKKYREEYDISPQGQEKRRKRQKAHVLKMRLRAVAEKGGKCAHCLQAFHHSAMDFHHVDPSTKETKVAKDKNFDQ